MIQSKILPLSITMEFGGVKNTIHPTLLWDEGNIVLIDSGFMGSLPLLEGELRGHGLALAQITGLVLTHHDHDHMGAAAALKRANPGLAIYASREEAPFLSAKEKPPRLCQAEAMQKVLPPEQKAFGEAFCGMLRRLEPVEADCLLQAGESLDWCGGCRVIATPGHTPGHISLLVEKESILITGDAMALEEGVPVIANPQFTFDMDQAVKSMEKLLSMKAKAYFCYHGGVYAPGE